MADCVALGLAKHGTILMHPGGSLHEQQGRPRAGIHAIWSVSQEKICVAQYDSGFHEITAKSLHMLHGSTDVELWIRLVRLQHT